jgi:hypothetical protein
MAQRNKKFEHIIRKLVQSWHFINLLFRCAITTNFAMAFGPFWPVPAPSAEIFGAIHS